MARKCMMRREKKRAALIEKHKKTRQKLRQQLNDPALDIEEKFKVLAQYKKLPKDSSRVRSRRRCQVTGRARGVYRRFGLCRNILFERAMNGEIPGFVMASW